MSLKIMGIACSPRSGQSTFTALRTCLDSAGQTGDDVEVDLIELAGREVRPCVDCGACREGLTCTWSDDFMDLVPRLAAPELAGLVIATPVYFGSMTAQCKALLDRAVMFRRNGWRLKDKVGGVLAVGGVRNGGQELTCQIVRAAMLCHDMICVGDGQDTGHFGASLHSRGPGGIEGDEFGLATAANLGRRVADVARQLHGD
jgi:multimeric flavodoxin WrbA